MKNQEKTQDWANLTKYQTQNSQLQIPIFEEKRIVFMGDSITEFWSKIYPEFFLNKPYIMF